MISFLVFCSLLIPVNLWAAITPHMHSDVSMRILHGVCTVVLLPLLWTLWEQRRLLRPVPALILGDLCDGDGGGEQLDHRHGHGRGIRLAGSPAPGLSEVALTVFFLMAPEPEPITEP